MSGGNALDGAAMEVTVGVACWSAASPSSQINIRSSNHMRCTCGEAERFTASQPFLLSAPVRPHGQTYHFETVASRRGPWWRFTAGPGDRVTLRWVGCRLPYPASLASVKGCQRNDGFVVVEGQQRPLFFPSVSKTIREVHYWPSQTSAGVSPQLSLALIELQAPIFLRAHPLLGSASDLSSLSPRSLRASFAAGRAVPMQLCSGLLHRQSGWVFVPHGAYRGRCPHRCYCHGWGACVVVTLPLTAWLPSYDANNWSEIQGSNL